MSNDILPALFRDVISVDVHGLDKEWREAEIPPLALDRSRLSEKLPSADHGAQAFGSLHAPGAHVTQTLQLPASAELLTPTVCQPIGVTLLNANVFSEIVTSSRP
jgi:hypothetical protein